MVELYETSKVERRVSNDEESHELMRKLGEAARSA